MHAIEFLTDDDMPEGHDFMFIVVAGNRAISYREGAVSPGAVEDSWTAGRVARKWDETLPPGRADSGMPASPLPGCNGTSSHRGEVAPPNQPATPNRTVRVSDELWEAARAKAEAEGVTLADVIRRCLERFLRD